jgi:hypothetical protein
MYGGLAISKASSAIFELSAGTQMAIVEKS